MADNIPISTGSGAASVATDDVGGVQYQRIKISTGADGASASMLVSTDGAAHVSVVGTPTVSFSGSGSIIAVPSGTQNVSGSVASHIKSGSVIAVLGGNTSVVVSNFPTNQNVSGSVVAFMGGAWSTSIIGTVDATVSSASVVQQGTWRTSVISSTPSSMLVGASIFGQLPAGTAPIGSIATLQGTNPWVVTNIGSVLSREAPLASLVQGTADLRVVQGGSVAALPAPGAGIRYYVNHVQISNFGSASVLVKISDNTTSTLGWSIAPAGGGSNYNANYRAAANSPITASINGTASVLVSMQGFTA